MANSIMRRLQGMPVDKVMVLKKENSNEELLLTATQLMNEVRKNTFIGKLITADWDNILFRTHKERERMRKHYKIAKGTKDKYPYSEKYYTKQRFLYFFWVFSVGMFDSEAMAEGFLNSVIEDEIFEKNFTFRKVK